MKNREGGEGGIDAIDFGGDRIDAMDCSNSKINATDYWETTGSVLGIVFNCDAKVASINEDAAVSESTQRVR